MSLFVCDECEVVENTALTNWYGYHGRNLKPATPENLGRPAILTEIMEKLGDGKARCSECISGTWHGKWPRKKYDPVKDKDRVVNR